MTNLRQFHGEPAAFVVACLLLVATAPAQAQSITLKSGENADLGAVYWVANCVSQLTGVPSVDVLSGPPEITLSIRTQSVTAARQNCSNPVPGGVVVATAGSVKSEFRGKLEYRVQYPTTGGLKQSTHTRDLALYP